jgi:hypothetical protein
MDITATLSLCLAQPRSVCVFVLRGVSKTGTDDDGGARPPTLGAKPLRTPVLISGEAHQRPIVSHSASGILQL